jgi:polysaccharide pyruvyl transferase WcaK-like protein
MHSCIGALGQGVPTVALAYSDKTLGVFETAGAGDWVVDPRKETGDRVVERIAASVDQRKTMAERLAKKLPDVRAQLDAQFEEIVSVVASVAR